MKLIIVGLTQHPGHFSHIVAFYRMGVKCGFDTSVLTYADSVKYCQIMLMLLYSVPSCLG